MKKPVCVFLFFGLFVHSIAQSQDLLSGKITKEQLSHSIISQTSWLPFPRIDDREGWSRADRQLMESYLSKAEEYLNFEWPYIPATKSMLIVRNGNRTEYEAISFNKRRVLGTLLLAEIYENKGRFTDQVIDGIWSICEESWWGVPAHLPGGAEYNGLVDVRDPIVDLFAAETATFLAWIDYFMGEKLDAVSPQIRERIYYETNKRIFEPAMEKSHWWMGAKFGGRLVTNNWTPWICSNWLNTALLLEKNNEKRTAMVYKIMEVLDQFVNPYPADGGCDEGPSYWGAAAASLFDNLAMLNEVTNGAFDYVFEDEKIKNMGRYIYRAQISEKYFLNFADADPQPGMSASMIYRFGKAIGDNDMMVFGAYYQQGPSGELTKFHFFRNLYELFLQNEFLRAEKRLPLPKDVWLPGLQVMAARDSEGTTDGFFVAAKGGHNAESHNHNDIGNFVVFYDGLPLLIDVGRGTYTKKTFSSRRYEIWYNCSDYHNLPTVNGKTQLVGREYEASDVKYQASDNSVQYSLDISKAFPDDAGINSLQRTIQYKRGKQVMLTDIFNLRKAEQITEHFMTVYPAEVINPGQLVIHYQNETGDKKDFILRYDARKMSLKIEKIKFETEEDQGVLQKWGDRIFRINFEFISPKMKDQASFVISAK
ncbi:MAG: heparinase [Bacteroidetes bacterium GWF2_42_66]|nr:MAG: heparinase [Bacteroidetes bacterium GWA2_42_15]OFX98440.1 MAG: heparinase [Bacteroidetes bacterium GWE2_42_39]OFY42825.1 MAG: heparinase [Bacteroidetes bacterium GWF2_42_66]HBL74450.1 heparinase [Prolixibacteraceae bacterium]HCR89122.1 heparinase [Prolixibacteraceae bacterium]